jgi:hypothetical protein
MHDGVLAFSMLVEGVSLRVDKLKLGVYRYSLAKKAMICG